MAESKNNLKKVQVTKSKRAGLLMPVGKIARMLRTGRYAPRVGVKAAVSMAAILEYVVAELLQVSMEQAQKSKKARIAPRHIMDARSKDEQFGILLKSASFFCDSASLHKKAGPSKAE